MHITNVNNRPDWYVATYKDRYTGYNHFGIASTRLGAMKECLESIYQTLNIK